MKKKVIIAPLLLVAFSTLMAGVAEDLVGIWYANGSEGYLGNEVPGSGSLAGAGWNTYWLSFRADSSFSVVGQNIYDDPPYGDGDGVIHYSGTYTIDTTQTPMWVDLTCEESDNAFFPADPAVQPLQNSIFELNGDVTELTIQHGSELAYGVPRPTEFMTDSLGNYDCGTLLKQNVEELLVSGWYADGSTGDLGNEVPGSGSLAGAGWLTYSLTMNSDGTFAVEGQNVYDDPPYGDGDGVVHYSGSYTIDASQSPMWVDLTCELSDNAFFPTDVAVQPLQNSIFELNGDATELTIQHGSELAYGVPRPTEFMTDSLGNYDCGTLVRQEMSVSEAETFQPSRIRLVQNYPNPFNPVTHIRYELSERVRVKIGVIDLLGRYVATLVDDVQDKGSHVLNWDAAGLNSGVYFIHLEAGGYVETRKAVFLK